MKRWNVVVVPEVDQWLITVSRERPRLAERVAAAIDMLEIEGPQLGRPLVDRVKGPSIHHMKELRVETVRALFVFDPGRRAVILAIGDKSGRWNEWYRENLGTAERRYARWLAEEMEAE